MSQCSICLTRLDGDPGVACPVCQSVHHQTCWDEIGGCATYGCTRAAVAHKPPVAAVVGGGWGDRKECPACGAQLGASLLVCRCGARFPWADPMTPEEYAQSVAAARALGRARATLVALFVASLLGVTAPLAGPVAGLYAHRRRRRLLGTGGSYLALGYGSAAIGAFYTLLIALVAVGH